ncbi:MAG: hypothetical protein ACOVQX_07470 [Legionella sp.]
MDYDLYSRLVEWPDEIDSISFYKPVQGTVPAYIQFIELCYRIKQEPEGQAEQIKLELQKIFAYLLQHVNAQPEREREKQQMFLCTNLFNLYPALIDTQANDPQLIKYDIQTILNYLSQNNRAWVKTCLLQALKRRFKQLQVESHSQLHDKLLDVAYLGSEVANIGIVLQEVVGGLLLGPKWIAIGIAVSRYSNPVIYAFKAVQRLFKFTGRNFLNLEFFEDDVGINPHQDFWDLLSAGIFIIITGLLVVNTPLMNSLAWLLAPVGLCIVWKSEYGYQNERAADRLMNMNESDGLFSQEDQIEAARIARHKKIASYALFGVILGITVGMLAVHAASVPGLNLIFNEKSLGMITGLSGGILTCLAAIRAGNFFWERQGNLLQRAEIKPEPVSENIINLLAKSIARSSVAIYKAVLRVSTNVPVTIVTHLRSLELWQKLSIITSCLLLFLVLNLTSISLSSAVGFMTIAAYWTVGLAMEFVWILKEPFAWVRSKDHSNCSNMVANPYRSEIEVNNAFIKIKEVATGKPSFTVPNDDQQLTSLAISFDSVQVSPMVALVAIDDSGDKQEYSFAPA